MAVLFPCQGLCWQAYGRAPAVLGTWHCSPYLSSEFSRFLLLSFLNFPSFSLARLTVFLSVSLFPISSKFFTLCRRSHFVFSRGGSGKLWRVQSPGRGSEEYWGWQLLVHEQTAGRDPGKLVCSDCAGCLTTFSMIGFKATTWTSSNRCFTILLILFSHHSKLRWRNWKGVHILIAWQDISLISVSWLAFAS